MRSSLVDYGFLLSDTLLVTQANLLKKIEQQKDVFYTSDTSKLRTKLLYVAKDK